MTQKLHYYARRPILEKSIDDAAMRLSVCLSFLRPLLRNGAFCGSGDRTTEYLTIYHNIISSLS